VLTKWLHEWRSRKKKKALGFDDDEKGLIHGTWFQGLSIMQDMGTCADDSLHIANERKHYATKISIYRSCMLCLVKKEIAYRQETSSGFSLSTKINNGFHTLYFIQTIYFVYVNEPSRVPVLFIHTTSSYSFASYGQRRVSRRYTESNEKPM
jgi:hypothetical protein